LEYGVTQEKSAVIRQLVLHKQALLSWENLIWQFQKKKNLKLF
jgi:hypothetical protein